MGARRRAAPYAWSLSLPLVQDVVMVYAIPFGLTSPAVDLLDTVLDPKLTP